MSWKMMLVLAALVAPAAGCKTVSQDTAPATAVQEKGTEPGGPKVEPAKVEPAKAEETKPIKEEEGATSEVKAGEEAKPSEGGTASEPKTE